MNNPMNRRPAAQSGVGGRLPRRDVMRFFAGAGVFVAAGGMKLSAAREPAKEGYGTDPDLTKIWNPGDAWPLTMTAEEKVVVTALADLILPADDLGPAASELRVPDYLDEWISAPYPDQQAARPVILEGLQWLDTEATNRFDNDFSSLKAAEQGAICDDICDLDKAGPAFKAAAGFFRLFRSMAMGAYYSTPEGWKALGYVGNVASQRFDGPPPEVLAKLGLEQTVR